MKMRAVMHILPVFFIAVLVTGCNAKKTNIADTDASSGSDNTGEVVRVENAKGDLNKIVSQFMGKTLEEAKKDDAEYNDKEDRLSYNSNAENLEYTGMVYLDVKHTKPGPGPRFSYADNYEMAGSKYNTVVHDFIVYHVHTTIDWGLRKLLPDEELNSCSKDEVLGYCKPYAEVLGYNDSNSVVEVYAMTLDKLKSTEDPNGAPYKGLKNDHELSDDELKKIKDCPWSKEYEALYLVYKPVINGLVLESYQTMLSMVYVPKYGKIVCAEGTMPWKIKEKTESEELISKDEAVSLTMNLNNITDKKDIEVKDVKLVYSQSFDNREGSNDTLVLCWKVDYKRLNSAEYSGDTAYTSELIEADSGEECVSFPGLGD